MKCVTGDEKTGVFVREKVWLRLFFKPNILNPSYTSHLLAYEDATDRAFRNVGI
jgi:hypothetical protein